jgi:hypothetical protein
VRIYIFPLSNLLCNVPSSYQFTNIKRSRSFCNNYNFFNLILRIFLRNRTQSISIKLGFHASGTSSLLVRQLTLNYSDSKSSANSATSLQFDAAQLYLNCLMWIHNGIKFNHMNISLYYLLNTNFIAPLWHNLPTKVYKYFNIFKSTECNVRWRTLKLITFARQSYDFKLIKKIRQVFFS